MEIDIDNGGNFCLLALCSSELSCYCWRKQGLVGQHRITLPSLLIIGVPLNRRQRVREVEVEEWSKFEKAVLCKRKRKTERLS